jgi:hypothetical protein
MGTPHDQYTGRGARPGGEDVQLVTRRADVDDRSAKPTAGLRLPTPPTPTPLELNQTLRARTAIFTASLRQDGQYGGPLGVHTSTCATCGASSPPDTRAMLRTTNIAHASCPAALPYRSASSGTELQPGQRLARLTLTSCFGKVRLPHLDDPSYTTASCTAMIQEDITIVNCALRLMVENGLPTYR